MDLKYEDMNATLRLCPGGVLLRRKWTDGKGAVLDISNRAVSFLMEDCELDENTTVGDVFLLLGINLEDLEPVIGNWVCELVLESTEEPEKEVSEDLKYAELYWTMNFDEFGTWGMSYPSFHGVGETDKYGLDFSSPATIKHLPLKLNDTLTICRDEEKPLEIKNPEYSLLHILYSIIWELSFFGSPESRKAKMVEFTEQVKSIQDGTAEMMKFDSVDDLLESLKSRSEEILEAQRKEEEKNKEN